MDTTIFVYKYDLYKIILFSSEGGLLLETFGWKTKLLNKNYYLVSNVNSIAWLCLDLWTDFYVRGECINMKSKLIDMPPWFSGLMCIFSYEISKFMRNNL